MHVRDLVELAALVAVHAPQILRPPRPLPASAIEQYWLASKCRIERWLRLLHRLGSPCEQSPRGAADAWLRLRPAFEEMLVSELLTRIWTAVAVVHDRLSGVEDLEPVVRNIFVGHLDVRRRLLRLLNDSRVMQRSQAESLDRLRRRVERWTDMLLAHIGPILTCGEFAFETTRASDFADDLEHDSTSTHRGLTFQLMQASLSASFADCLGDRSPNGDLNRRIGSAILSCFPAAALESPSLAQGLWVERIAHAANDTQAMIDDLLRLDDPQPACPLAAAKPA